MHLAKSAFSAVQRRLAAVGGVVPAADEEWAGGAAHRAGGAGPDRLFDLSPIDRRNSCDAHGHGGGGGGGGAERGGTERAGRRREEEDPCGDGVGGGVVGGGSPQFGEISGLQASMLSTDSPGAAGGGRGRGPTAPPPSPPTPEETQPPSRREPIPDAVKRSTPPPRPGGAAAAARSPGVPPAGFVRTQAGLFGPVCGRAVHNTACLLPSPTAGRRPAPACLAAAAPAPPAIAGVDGGSRQSVGSGHGRLSSFGAVEAGPRFSLHRGPRYLF